MKKQNIENFMKKYKVLPSISTVESFEDIMEKSQNVGLPKNPKFIFTSNDYEHNEIFKFYVSKLSEKINPIITLANTVFIFLILGEINCVQNFQLQINF